MIWKLFIETLIRCIFIFYSALCFLKRFRNWGKNLRNQFLSVFASCCVWRNQSVWIRAIPWRWNSICLLIFFFFKLIGLCLLFFFLIFTSHDLAEKQWYRGDNVFSYQVELRLDLSLNMRYSHFFFLFYYFLLRLSFDGLLWLNLFLFAI